MKTKRILSVLTLAALLPIMAMADVYQAPTTKVNYEYDPDSWSYPREAKVIRSPLASGDVYISMYLIIGDMDDYKDYIVTSIDDNAFYGCSGITSVKIPSSVTTIGKYAFYGCSGLNSVTIPEGVTSIGRGAFSNCDGLTAVNISNLAAWCGIEFDSYFRVSSKTVLIICLSHYILLPLQHERYKTRIAERNTPRSVS